MNVLFGLFIYLICLHTRALNHEIIGCVACSVKTTKRIQSDSQMTKLVYKRSPKWYHFLDVGFCGFLYATE